MIRPTLAIIGGMGIDAGIQFQTLLYRLDNITVEQDHINYLVFNLPKAPDRTSSLSNEILLEQFNGYLNYLVDSFNKLEIKNFAVTCNTAHQLILQHPISKKFNFINMIKITTDYIDLSFTDKTFVLLSTKGTKKGNLYNNLLNNSFVKVNNTDQQIIDEIIFETKRDGIKNKNIDKFRLLLNKLGNHNYFILGCTELSLYYKLVSDDFLLIDPLTLLAKEILNLQK